MEAFADQTPSIALLLSTRREKHIFIVIFIFKERLLNYYSEGDMNLSRGEKMTCPRPGVSSGPGS